MKGLGNYRFQRRPAKERQDIERQPAWLMGFRGDKAHIRVSDGRAFSIPGAPLKKIGVEPDQRFVLLIVRVNGEVRDVRVEALPPPRPPRVPGAMPKVVVRSGKKLTTRK